MKSRAVGRANAGRHQEVDNSAGVIESLGFTRYENVLSTPRQSSAGLRAAVYCMYIHLPLSYAPERRAVKYRCLIDRCSASMDKIWTRVYGLGSRLSVRI